MPSSANKVKMTSFFLPVRISMCVLLVLLPPSSLQLCNIHHGGILEGRALSQSQSQLSPLSPVDRQFSTIKTPSGTVKCSCQTVPDPEDPFPTPPSEGEGKQIEIEIYRPGEDLLEGSSSERDSVQVKRKPVINSFTLEGDVKEEEEAGADSEERLFSTEQPPSFLSLLSSFYRAELEGKQPEPEVAVPLNGGTGAYKAFRSSELKSSATPSQEHDNHRPYFTWDFVYGHNKPSPSIQVHPQPPKKREFLYLGNIIDSFKGPRRRRRRSLIGEKRSAPTVFVYPVGYDQQKGSDVIENQTVSASEPQIRSEPPVIPDRAMLEERMSVALDRAWSDYGPRGEFSPGKSYIPPPPPPPEQTSSVSNPKPQPVQQEILVSPIDSALPPHKQITPWHVQTYPYHYYRPPRPFLFIDRIFNPFQPMNSEWDKHVNIFSPQPDSLTPEPGFFSKLMARYIDFEVNNHERADLMRKVGFYLFVGFLVIGWIILGVVLGVIPLKKWLFLHTLVEKARGKEFDRRDADATLSDLTDKILLSLDADWLRRLEERVKGKEKLEGGVSAVGKIPIQVFCCILPDEKTSGMVECQVTKGQGAKKSGGGKKKTTAFKCISDLIYNFQFGPKEEGTGGGEPDNLVNLKGKANNDEQEGENIDLRNGTIAS